MEVHIARLRETLVSNLHNNFPMHLIFSFEKEFVSSLKLYVKIFVLFHPF